MSNKRNANVLYDTENSSSDELDSMHDNDLSSSRANSCSNGSNNSNKNELKSRKRGRGPSKNPCSNRNALMARRNRQKKKEYIENIENKLAYFRNENRKFIDILKHQNINLKRLNAEVTYLKNILKNNTTITALLNSMNSLMNKNYKNNNNKKIHETNEIKLNNEVKLLDNLETNTMVQGQMDHGIVPMNNEEGGRNLSVENNSTDLLSETDNVSPFFNHDYDELFNFEGVNCDPDTSEIISLDDITSLNSNITTIANSQPLFSSPPSSSSSSNSCNLDVFEKDIDEDIFKEKDNFDDVSNNYFRNESLHLENTENLFDNLDTSGICLHVNSGKISLEFCSICHLNSINSEDP